MTRTMAFTGHRASAGAALDGADTELAWLQELVFRHSGFVVADRSLPMLRRAVTTTAQHRGQSVADLLRELRDPAAHAAMASLINEVTIGESYFFRDPEQMQLLRTQLLPELIARKRRSDRTLRIWSAGCSRGQELYTLSMLLSDLLPDASHWRLELLGTDINQHFLAEAKQGDYIDWSLRCTSATARDRYFTPSARGHRVTDAVRERCRFRELNLVSGEAPWPPMGQDLILCRNVFIYFDDPTIVQVMERMATVLDPQGVIMVGAADRIPDGVASLVRRGAGHSAYWERPSRSVSAPTPAADDAPVRVPAPEPVSVQEVPVLSTPAAVLEEAIPALRALADEGQLAQATELAAQLVEDHPTEKEAHYMLGFLHAEDGDWVSARAAWERAAFLDMDFFEAQYQLGMCALRVGDQAKALRRLRNAMAIVRGKPRDGLSSVDPERTYGDLAEALEADLARMTT